MFTRETVAVENGVKITTVQPTLEEVYKRVTGESLEKLQKAEASGSGCGGVYREGDRKGERSPLLPGTGASGDNKIFCNGTIACLLDGDLVVIKDGVKFVIKNAAGMMNSELQK
jgi:hypothetical protein